MPVPKPGSEFHIVSAATLGPYQAPGNARGFVTCCTRRTNFMRGNEMALNMREFRTATPEIPSPIERNPAGPPARHHGRPPACGPALQRSEVVTFGIELFRRPASTRVGRVPGDREMIRRVRSIRTRCRMWLSTPRATPAAVQRQPPYTTPPDANFILVPHIACRVQNLVQMARLVALETASSCMSSRRAFEF